MLKDGSEGIFKGVGKVESLAKKIEQTNKDDDAVEKQVRMNSFSDV
jgi:hypothetical protein